MFHHKFIIVRWNGGNDCGVAWGNTGEERRGDFSFPVFTAVHDALLPFPLPPSITTEKIEIKPVDL